MAHTLETEEIERAHESATPQIVSEPRDLEEAKKDAFVQAAAVGGISSALTYYAHKTFPLVHRLNPSIKVFVPASLAYVTYFTASSVKFSHNSLQRRQTTNPRIDEPIFTEDANFQEKERQLMAQMTPGEKVLYLWHRHPFAGLALWTSPLVGYWAVAQARKPALKFSQRVMQTRVLGQATVVAGVVATAAIHAFYMPPSLQGIKIPDSLSHKRHLLTDGGPPAPLAIQRRRFTGPAPPRHWPTPPPVSPLPANLLGPAGGDSGDSKSSEPSRTSTASNQKKPDDPPAAARNAPGPRAHSAPEGCGGAL